MENSALFTVLLFGITTIIAVWLFYRAADNSLPALIIILSWLVFQSILSLAGFYLITDTIPPRTALLVLPPLLLLIALFATVKGRQFIDGLDPGMLTFLHIIRIPVEIVLYLLFLNKQVPRLMTFAGGNFDILSGLTAPVIFYFGFVKKVMNKKIILAWNMICLGLLLSVLIHALLSIPSRFQQLAFAQPNMAVLHFPYVWRPSCIVPIVLLSHAAMIRRLTGSR